MLTSSDDEGNISYSTEYIVELELYMQTFEVIVPIDPEPVEPEECDNEEVVGGYYDEDCNYIPYPTPIDCSLSENEEACAAIEDGSATDLIDDETLDEADQAIIDSIDDGSSTQADVPDIARDDNTYGKKEYEELSNFDIY